jgi:type VI secretion system secreted protein Hcp
MRNRQDARGVFPACTEAMKNTEGAGGVFRSQIFGAFSRGFRIFQGHTPMKLLRFCLAAFLLSLPLAPAANAAVILVLKLDGIEGESQVQGHAKEINLTSVIFSTEQTRMLNEASKTGAGAGKASFSPMIVTKAADKASPQLFLNSVLGKSIKTARISFISVPDGEVGPPFEFFSISLGNVFISKFTVSTSNGDSTTNEEVVLNYQAVVVNYTPPSGPSIITGFDLVRNQQISALFNQ